MSKITSLPLYVSALQILTGISFAFVGLLKFTGDESAIYVFTQLEMEPMGRYIIGLLEINAGFLLLSRMAPHGALLALSIMLGAFIAHFTVLGIQVNGDGGASFGFLCLLFVLDHLIIFFRRKELPLVGESF